ncbi:MAG: response regulator [Bdellovibrionota bacterium]
MNIEENLPCAKKMVLIDDDPIYRAIMLRAAKNEGIVLHAYDSLLSISITSNMEDYDAVIIDYDLGELTGVDIASYLSSVFGDIPMVLVSSSLREQKDGGKKWPKHIKKFALKTEGYSPVLAMAKELASTLNYDQPMQ